MNCNGDIVKTNTMRYEQEKTSKKELKVAETPFITRIS
jgi:hypothetical protein